MIFLKKLQLSYIAELICTTLLFILNTENELLKARMKNPFLRYLQIMLVRGKAVLPRWNTGLINNSDLPEEYNLFLA